MVLNSKESKTEQLILYISSKLSKHDAFGSVMLNKTLFYSDNIHYEKYGESITHLTYIRQNQGPTPKPELFMPLIERMLMTGVIKQEQKSLLFDKYVKKTIALRPHNMSLFTSEEIEIIDNVIAEMGKYNATQVSDLSHNLLGWKLAKNMEEIPFHAYLLSNADLTEEDMIWAEEKANDHKKLLNN